MRNLIISTTSALTWLFFASVSRALVVTTPTPTDRGLSGAPGVDITIQGLVAILLGLACYATKAVMVVMVIMIIWYGFRMMASGDNETNFKNARKSLNYAIVGMLVIFAANTIIATVGNTVAAVGAQNLSTRSKAFVNYTPLGSCSY